MQRIEPPPASRSWPVWPGPLLLLLCLAAGAWRQRRDNLRTAAFS